MLPRSTPFCAPYRAVALFAFVFFAVHHSLCLADQLETRSNVIPVPLSFSPDQNWDGDDGPWSSFTLRIGTPPQVARVFASTASQQVWVVQSAGCEYQTDMSYTTCAESRGRMFFLNQSSSWDTIGRFSLWIEQNLGYVGDADYGYDTVGLGLDGEGGPTLENTTVGALGTYEFYLGIFGLHPKPTNFSNFNEQSPSYMTKLKEQKIIPSLSYGYTAGNPYRLNGILASLTLGGYDTSRYIPNNMSFPFHADNERDLVVGIQKIIMDDATKQGVSLLPTPAYAFIDSTVSQIWLPLDACRAFEEAFGLTYDEKTKLYLVNDTLHERLVARNANVTFTLGKGLLGGQTIDIVLPYAAFDLNAKPPFSGLKNSTRYFPLQRADNDTQYTLGRTFLQEAYLVVDHERANFSVSQCIFKDTMPQILIAIHPLDTFNSSSKGPHLSTGAIAGIAVGTTIAICFSILFLLYYCWWSPRVQQRDTATTEHPKSASPESVEGGQKDLVYPKAELPADETARHELGSDINEHYKPEEMESEAASPYPPTEVDAADRQIFEMPGDLPQRQEADGRTLSEKEAMIVRERVYNGVDPAPSPITPTTPRRLAPVSPGDVAELRPEELVSPATGSFNLDQILSPLSPMESGSGSNFPDTPRRKFSFEEGYDESNPSSTNPSSSS